MRMDRINEWKNEKLLEGVQHEEIDSWIEPFIDLDLTEQNVSEALILDLNSEGKSYTIKLSNLRFRLADFLLEITKFGIDLTTSITNPLKLVIGALCLIRKIKDLSTVEITAEEAKVLLAIFRLKVEGQPVTLDNMFQLLSGILPEEKIRNSLTRLMELKCIEYTDDGIILIEEIIKNKQ